MHLIRILRQGMIILFMLFPSFSSGIINIGIVNSKWKTILERTLAGRNWTNKCQLHIINIPANISFYESINAAHYTITLYKIDIIIGESRLDIAQAAASLKVPFISFDSKLHIKSRPEYDSMPHFYTLPVSESAYALATFDILQYFKVTQAAIIIDETIDYQNFIKPFFEMKSLFIKVWTIPSYPLNNQNALDIAVGKIISEIRNKAYLNIVVKVNKHNLIKLMGFARNHGMISIPFRWYILGFVCDNFNINSLKHIYSNFTFINEVCSERNLLNNERFKENSLINQFIQIIRLVKWKFNPRDLKMVLRNNNRSLLSFDDYGNRNSYTLLYNTISRLPNKTLSLIGSWQKKIDIPGIFHMKIFHEEISNNVSIIPSHLIIIALEEHPHLIVEKGENIGFGVDLMRKLSEKLNFSFTINVISNEGGLKGKWDKLLSELIEGKADLSLGPVVQTKEREEKLDFSTSFKQREISLVMRKPKNTPSFFQFLGPFNNQIWLCVLSSIVILIGILWVLEHFHDKYFPIQESEDRIQFDLKESSWFIIASTLQGGAEYVPFSIPGRILTASLYFFVLIIVTSYTANLAAFLTVKAYTNPISSIDDLVNLPLNSEIQFGTVQNSAIFDFFYHSEIEDYQKIYRRMYVNNWMVNSSKEGYLKAKNENYVFIWDDSVNQFEISTEKEYGCQLYIVGLPFGKRSFAVGMPQGLSFKEQIDRELLSLLESGVIENLEHKWWKLSSKCPSSTNSEISSGSLSVEDLAGVFLILLCGVIIAIISLFIEILIHRGKAINSIRQCCSQFFSHLPISSDPPIVSTTPKNTLDHSRYSTTASSMKSERPQSPLSYEYIPPFIQSSNRFDFQIDSDSQHKSTPV